MNICSFIGCSCHPAELGTFPNRKSVIRQFNAVNSPETTPKEIFLSSILYIERINGILYIDFIAAEHLSMICKRTFGLIGSGTSDTTGPFATPDRHGIIKHVFITYFIDIRSPESSFRFKIRTSAFGKGSTHILPLHQVF